MKTVVLGLGNPILADDRVGIAVARELGRCLRQAEIEVKETAATGLALLDELVGYERAVIIDSIRTARRPVGSLHRYFLGADHPPPGPAGSHGIGLQTALLLGRLAGWSLPRRIVVYAVEAADTTTFSEELTPRVAAAVPRIVRTIIADCFLDQATERRPKCQD